MATKAAKLLRDLVRIRSSYGEGYGSRKVTLLRQLDGARLSSTKQISTLHEVLCFLRAYPDDGDLLEVVDGMLRAFDRRPDLARHRRDLADSGIAGTEIHYRFFWPMARWLARRWPQHLHIDWPKHETQDRLKAALPLLVTHPEAAAIRRSEEKAEVILERVAGANQTDATFVVNRIEALPGDDFTREALHDGIDSAYRLAPGPDTPSRTRARHSTGPIAYRSAPLSRERPDIRAELSRPPSEVRDLSVRRGRALIDLACEAMVTRSRDLEVFLYGDPRDVRLVIDHEGLAFACIGFIPERRLWMRAAYGLLTLQNGVPIGYVQADALFRSAEIAFNTFDTFRGGEAARVFARLLAAVNHLFGAASFSIEPYQLGHENEEGIESGAWWFYYKLGFRPAHRGVERLVARELARMKKDPSHRSSRQTLEKLAERHLYFELDPVRQPVEADLEHLGWQVAEQLRERFAGDRERATEALIEETATRLGLRTWGETTPAEKNAIARWSPILAALPGVERWSRRDRHSAADVIKAKGGRRESDFVHLFDAHPKLARALSVCLWSSKR